MGGVNVSIPPPQPALHSKLLRPVLPSAMNSGPMELVEAEDGLEGRTDLRENTGDPPKKPALRAILDNPPLKKAKNADTGIQQERVTLVHGYRVPQGLTGKEAASAS
jgi:hypothetical protein